jgi:glycosyltransferase involved in cell wall biosynthesis
MGDGQKLTIVIPAFNEADNLEIFLPQVIEFCNKNEWKLIIIDDGSTDNTPAILRKYDTEAIITFIRHKLNKGYGAAIKRGLSACTTEYAATMDADGQHDLSDIEKLYSIMLAADADMMVGSRKGIKSATLSRGFAKSIIRILAKILMKVPIYDINSGMKIYRTGLVKKYLYMTPDTMSYSDIITLIFLNNRHLVIEEPIKIRKRLNGKSTLSIQTAFQTMMEIINIVILFNPMKIFLPISLLMLIPSLAWGIPLIMIGRGVSVATLLGLISSLIFFLLGLIAEQLSLIRRNQGYLHFGTDESGS